MSASDSVVNRLSLYEPYIKELRNKAFRIVICFAIGAAIGMLYYQKILTRIMGFFKLEGINLVLTSPYQFIDLSAQTGFVTGVMFAFPITLYYFLKFIRPALKPKEFQLLIRMIPLSLILFVAGFLFGVWIVQYVIDFFYSTTTGFAIDNIWDLSGFLSQILTTGISLALVFQMPIVLTALLRLKILKIQAVKAQRKVVYSGLLLFAALLPPSDIISLSLLTLVPLFLFEITLVLNPS